MSAADNLARMSAWVDEGNAGKSAELMLHVRVGKIAEEAGEAQAALIGCLGENPRKGFTHTRGDVIDELLDVAIAALGAVEHMTSNVGASVELLEWRLRYIISRIEQQQ